MTMALSLHCSSVHVPSTAAPVQPETATPSPAEKPLPMLAAESFMATSPTGCHMTPSYCIRAAPLPVSSHRSPLSGPPGAAAPVV